MLYFVKSHGPAVLKRGPFETKEEANKKRDELKQDPMYKDQAIFVVEEQSDVQLERVLIPSRRRGPKQKPRDRGRSDSRGGGSSAKAPNKRPKQRPSRRK